MVITMEAISIILVASFILLGETQSLPNSHYNVPSFYHDPDFPFPDAAVQGPSDGNYQIHLSGIRGLDYPSPTPSPPPPTATEPPVCTGGVLGQAQCAFTNIGTILDYVSNQLSVPPLTLTDLVKCTVYMPDSNDITAFDSAWQGQFPTNQVPARASVFDIKLLKSDGTVDLDAKFELRCIAQIPPTPPIPTPPIQPNYWQQPVNMLLNSGYDLYDLVETPWTFLYGVVEDHMEFQTRAVTGLNLPFRSVNDYATQTCSPTPPPPPAPLTSTSMSGASLCVDEMSCVLDIMESLIRGSVEYVIIAISNTICIQMDLSSMNRQEVSRYITDCLIMTDDSASSATRELYRAGFSNNFGLNLLSVYRPAVTWIHGLTLRNNAKVQVQCNIMLPTPGPTPECCN